MKMTISNAEMANYIDLMSQLEETGKLGYAIARNLRKLKDEATEYIDLRSKLFQKYGDIDQEKGTARVRPENASKFLEELGDIPGIKHDVDIFTVSEDEFMSGALTSSQMEALLWMIKEEE